MELKTIRRAGEIVRLSELCPEDEFTTDCDSSCSYVAKSEPYFDGTDWGIEALRIPVAATD